MNVNEYIASGAIELNIMGLANEEEKALYLKMRSMYIEVVDHANQFELDLEKKHFENAMLEPNKNNFAAITSQISAQKTTPVVSLSQNNNTEKAIWKKYAVAASLALLLGSTALNFMLAGKLKESQKRNEELAKNNTTPKNNLGDASFAFLKEQTIVPVAMNGVGIHYICRCSLFWDKAKNIAYLQIHHLFPPGEEKDYQVWALVDGKPISLGILKYNVEKVPIAIPNVPENATQFTVTLENKGGAEKPTEEELYLKGQIST